MPTLRWWKEEMEQEAEGREKGALPKMQKEAQETKTTTGSHIVTFTRRIFLKGKIKMYKQQVQVD